MELSRDVILDLLPLYRANEASLASKNLVEAWLANHPDEAQRIEHSLALDLPTEAPDPRERLEMAALAKTKFYLKWRAFLFATAIFTTCLIFAFGDTSFDQVEGVHWLWQENPKIAIILGGVSAFLWLVYFRLSKRLKVTGL